MVQRVIANIPQYLDSDIQTEGEALKRDFRVEWLPSRYCYYCEKYQYDRNFQTYQE